MSTSIVRAIWSECKDHVEMNLSHAKSHEERLLYVETMAEYFEERGYSKDIVKELKILMGMRSLHYTLEPPKEEVKEFNPQTESYIIIPKDEVKRVRRLIEDRNTMIKSKIVYRIGP